MYLAHISNRTLLFKGFTKNFDDYHGHALIIMSEVFNVTFLMQIAHNNKLSSIAANGIFDSNLIFFNNSKLYSTLKIQHKSHNVGFETINALMNKSNVDIKHVYLEGALYFIRKDQDHLEYNFNLYHVSSLIRFTDFFYSAPGKVNDAPHRLILDNNNIYYLEHLKAFYPNMFSSKPGKLRGLTYERK